MKPADMHIVVVDDEPLILELVSELFSKFEFRVSGAFSGNEAWKQIENEPCDLILSDVRMPDGDGFELIKKVKAKYGNRTSFLFMSGFSDFLNEELYHLGAEGKFDKPFDLNAVRDAIKKCFLSPELKWNHKVPSGDMLVSIKKSGSDVLELESKKSVLFGRGGFFISHAFVPPARGSSILFSIEIQKPQPITFAGTGIVRWIQSLGKNTAPGLGIEITSMGKDDAKIYNQLFGNRIPFIPSVLLSKQENKKV